MDYKFNFDKNKCWWKDICVNYNTDKCSKLCIRYSKIHYLANNALLTEKQQYPPILKPFSVDKSAFEQLDKLKLNIVNFVKDGNNLLIHSEKVGNGKTTWAIKMLMRYFSEIWTISPYKVRGLFINVTRFFNSAKANIDSINEYYRHIDKHIYDADLVVWDDIGMQPLTAYEHAQLYSYINYRVDAGKSNIFTTNLSLQSLVDNASSENETGLGNRLGSRVVNNSILVELNGKDCRGELLK